MANGETPNPVLGVQVPPPLINKMKILDKITGFINEVKVELGKVSWSTKQELIGSTTVVITLTALMTLFIFIVDFALSKILSIIFKA